MRLKELKISDFQENQKYDFLFPIGATEQHGPFLPFGTDTYITDYLVTKIADEFPELIILPTLELSRSQEHRGFYGTLYLSEETLTAVLKDVCNSLKDKARNIFITSFHANDPYIKKFINENTFSGINIIHLKISNTKDDEYISEKILQGQLDDHAGNSEISNMLVIKEQLVEIPSSDYPKTKVNNPFETDNLREKSPNGIADNHRKWLTNKDIGKRILDIYVARMIEGLEKYIQNKSS
ncbi:creatininase family protein [Candidatus Dojkabacteria bacterium]|uniref:Creatininase family protein n=1 Tax=Candidatus Dojkabacteria bacterium TaxID=2099670 RepID=A0A955RK56_9BACT|nr:creatininase family protein [Candidatus Dojkabacteria bacterium]